MAAFGVRVDDLAASQRLARGRPAQDVAVAAHADDRFADLQLQPALLAREELFGAQQAQPRQDFGSADEQLHFGVVVQRLVRHPAAAGSAHPGAAWGGNRRGEPPRRRAAICSSEMPGDINGGAAAGDGGLFFLLVGLQAAHAAAQTRREDFNFVTDLEAAVASACR